MEQLNKVELRGVAGTVRIDTINGVRCAHISLETNFAYKLQDGTPAIETDWHDIRAWESPSISLERICKGAKLHVIGRIRYQQYTDQNGYPRTETEILAYECNVMDGGMDAPEGSSKIV